MKRYLGVDLGTRRVGLAISDELGIIASPLRTVSVKTEDQALSEVEKAFAEENAVLIVLGLARNMNGKIGPKAKECQNFAERLKEKNYKVELWDERLTSIAAEKAMLEANMSRKKRKEKIDALAAQMILQSYLESIK
ncbi:MAG: Holliday junction resolvase RuvX [Planctomycetota bacterium]